MKKYWLILFLLMLGSGAAYLWQREPAAPASESDPGPRVVDSGTLDSDDRNRQPEPLLAEELLPPGREPPGSVTGEKQNRQTASTSGEAGPSPQTTRAIDEQLQDSYRRTADSVMLGDPDSAIELARLLDHCRSGFRSEDQIQRNLASMAGKGEWDKTKTMMIRGEALSFGSFSEYESYMWKRYDQCRALNSITGQNLHEDIRSAADAGDPVARYVFAMWPPEQSFGTTAAMLDYHDRALEYTWQNIEEGQPLGLLALGQSYMNRGTSPLFTPWNHTLGRIFLLAAAKCGLSNAWLDGEIDLMLDGLSSSHPSAQQILGQLNSQSDELRRLYCG